MHPIPEETSKMHLHSSESKFENDSRYLSGSVDQGWTNNSSKVKTVLGKFVTDLISSGKNETEVTKDLEDYFNTLAVNCDDEIVDLQEQLEIEKAMFREEAADEVYLKANEIDQMSNIFIECIHSHRKSLRQQLIKMKFTNLARQNAGDYDNSEMPSNFLQQTGMSVMSSKTSSGKPNLLDTYLRIVKTGAPEEIERFS